MQVLPSFRLFMLLIALLTGLLGVREAHVIRQWTASDWLINYQGGFVRRGLDGELLLHLHRATHLPFLTEVAFTIVLCQAVILVCWYRLVTQSTLSLWTLAVAVSPATIAFSALNPFAGFHKELLLLAFFLPLLTLPALGKLPPPAMAILFSAGAAFTILSHEASFFFLPYFSLALFALGWTRAQVLRCSLAPALVAILAFAASALWHGSRQTAVAICTSLGYTLNNSSWEEICHGGAIDYLQHSSQSAFLETRQYIGRYHALPVYAGLLVLSLLPLLFGAAALLRTPLRSTVRSVLQGTLLCTLFSIPLFLLAMDWGRWIHLHILFTASLLLALDGRHPRHALLRHSASARSAASPRIRLAEAAALALYALVWSLPGNFDGHWPSFRTSATEAASLLDLHPHRLVPSIFFHLRKHLSAPPPASQR